MIRSLDGIKDALDRKAAQLLGAMPEPDPDFLPAITLEPSRLSMEDLEAVETALGISLPVEFRRTALIYDLECLELGAVTFGSDKPFGEFLLEEIAEMKKRGSDRFTIARAEGAVLDLDVTRGFVWEGGAGSQSPELVASDFDLFLRGVASVFLLESCDDEDDFARSLGSAVGAARTCEFWRDLVKGFA